MDAWEELSNQMKLVEAEEAMGEDDGILGGLCKGLGACLARDAVGPTVFGADVGIIVLYCGTKI